MFNDAPAGFKAGDLVTVEVSGVLAFPAPVRIRSLCQHDDKTWWAFVEGSASAVRVECLTPAVARERAALEPDLGQIEIFVDALFRHAGNTGFVAIRSFFEDEDKSFRLSPTSLAGGLDFINDVAEDDARRAAQFPRPVVFCPPIAVFGNKDHAGERDLLAGPVLSVELDQHPLQALAKLESLLGPATVVVKSGGIWNDPDTGEVEDKLHAHWRLQAPARGDDLIKLKAARKLATAITGGDPSNVPISHPIRWPGSWHRKAEPRLCTIERSDADIEIDLDAALKILTAAGKAANENGEFHDPGNGAVWEDLVASIVTGRSYHPSLVSLSARLVGAGLLDGQSVKLLRSIMQAATAPRDARWQARFAEIPRIVSSAREKFGDGNRANGAVDPVDLWAKFDPPTLPRGVLPEVIEAFAFDRGMAMGCDMGGLAVSALAVCAAAIPDSIQLQPKKHDTEWLESARLWITPVGSPSTMKSPMMAAAVKPLRRIDTEMAKANQRAMADYNKLSAEERKQTEPPKQTRLMMQDTTIEAAQEILKDSPNGVLSYQDELSGWFGAMDKYSGGERVPQRIGHSGCSPLTGALIPQTASVAGLCSSRTFRSRCWAASSPSRSGSWPRTAATTGSCNA